MNDKKIEIMSLVKRLNLARNPKEVRWTQRRPSDKNHKFDFPASCDFDSEISFCWGSDEDFLMCRYVHEKSDRSTSGSYY